MNFNVNIKLEFMSKNECKKQVREKKHQAMANPVDRAMLED